MKDPYRNPGEDDSLDAALDAANALDTELVDSESTSDDEGVEEDDDVECEKDDDEEEEGDLPEDWDDDAWDQEDPNDD